MKDIKVKIKLSRGMTLPKYATDGSAAVDLRAAIEENAPVTIEPGERIAQLMVAPYYVASFTESDELSDTVRGEGGFGSTGSK